MSQLSPFVRFARTLSRRLHEEAELRMPRERRVSPPRDENYENEPTALLLGSLAQCLDATATDLEQQIATDLGRTGNLEPAPVDRHNCHDDEFPCSPGGSA